MRSQRARDPHPHQPHHPFEPRQGRREGAEPRSQEEARWAHRHRPREGAALHGEDWRTGSQEGPREERQEGDKTKDPTDQQGYGAHYDAQSDAIVERERLRLTELWLQGERLALQALYTHFGGEGEVAAY
jgi:hypothetical protein